MVRLRLYRFSERNVFRELLMNTVTVGAESPVISIAPRPEETRSPARCRTPVPEPPRLLGYQPRPYRESTNPHSHADSALLSPTSF